MSAARKLEVSEAMALMKHADVMRDELVRQKAVMETWLPRTRSRSKKLLIQVRLNSINAILAKVDHDAA